MLSLWAFLPVNLSNRHKAQRLFVFCGPIVAKFADRILIILIISVLWLVGCGPKRSHDAELIKIVDQLGRRVEVPRHMTRIAALYHFGGGIVYALGQQDKLVEQSLYGRLANALSKVDTKFAAKQKMSDGHSINYESIIALRPQCAIVYSSFTTSEMQHLEGAGIRVIAVKGETLEESFSAVRLLAKVLECEDKGEEYIGTCRHLMSLVQDRIKEIPQEKRLRVVFTGPKSIYTVATGEMLQSQMLEQAGAINLASGLKGFWGDVSAEQMAAWNPDVIFLGSSLSTYAVDEVLRNSQYQSIGAVRNRRIYPFPSNVGWWDYPAPHCILGTVWTAKILYPERFKDVDMLKIADEFYLKYLGHTFTSMGGTL
jgi:iron complex transport system substrate-binding protein